MNTLSPPQTGLLPQVTHPRNPGMALDLDWVASVQANTSAIERRAATLPGRRSVKKDYQAAWLLKAISLIDLTTLSGDDTAGRVQRLCAKARQPVAPWMLERLGMQGLTTGAVCVYHGLVATAVKALEGSGVPVAAVSTVPNRGDWRAIAVSRQSSPPAPKQRMWASCGQAAAVRCSSSVNAASHSAWVTCPMSTIALSSLARSSGMVVT